MPTPSRISSTFEEHSVLLFRGQTLDDAAQVAFSRRFGPLETTIRTVVSHARYRPEISNLANVDGEDRLIPRGDRRNLFNAGNQMWHTDSSFKRVPALASLLSGREVPPEGGETEFASMRVAYERLPDATRRRLEGKVAARRSSSPRTPARSRACRPTRPARSFVTSSSGRQRPSSSTRIDGARATW
jgi:alpha-ketoglutarate-dependent 2,4-dichlorophenoxyacetate dioxygenase